jgi:hypothetical protein
MRKNGGLRGGRLASGGGDPGGGARAEGGAEAKLALDEADVFGRGGESAPSLDGAGGGPEDARDERGGERDGVNGGDPGEDVGGVVAV